jgi:hypothetical protein
VKLLARERMIEIDDDRLLKNFLHAPPKRLPFWEKPSASHFD